MANKRQRLARQQVSKSTTPTTTTDDGGAGTVLKVKSHKIAKAKRKAVRSDEKTGGSKRKPGLMKKKHPLRVPGKKPGDGCFICKSTDHVARACPHKLGKDRKKLLPRKVPRTLENTREQDETIAQPDDDELHAEDAADEFSAHFNHERTPQLLITSSRWCSTITIKFIAELVRVLPNAHYYKRGSYELKQIVKYAKNRDFTAIIVIHDNRKEPNGMLLINLPEGPTVHFKLSNTVLSKKIKGHGKPTSHLPELILNNFTTRIGHRVGRMLASLFPQHPNFRGRRAVTFHNQRDFIFFRHHRYIFEAKEVKESAAKLVSKVEGSSKESGGTAKKSHKEAVIARLQECGPRFTMKLLSLQHGTFNSKFGEYEWVHKADMDTSRRRFFM